MVTPGARSVRRPATSSTRARSAPSWRAPCTGSCTAARAPPLLRRAAASGRALDLQDVLERFAFDNICRIAFEHDPRQLPDEGDDAAPEDGGTSGSRFADAFRDAANLSAGRFRYAVPGFWRVKKAFNVGFERRLHDSIAMVHDFADRIIRARWEEMMSAGCEKRDLLSRFMASQDETYAKSGVPLGDVVISFLRAGRETTSSALSWFFWLLSSRIRDEVAAV